MFAAYTLPFVSMKMYNGIARFPCDSTAFLCYNVAFHLYVALCRRIVSDFMYCAYKLCVLLEQTEKVTIDSVGLQEVAYEESIGTKINDLDFCRIKMSHHIHHRISRAEPLEIEPWF